jgi:hypothetical protein
MTTQSEQYLQECRDALGAEQARSLAETNNWSHVDKQKVHSDWDVLYRKLAPMIGQLPPTAQAVQALIAEHYGIVSRFYTPSKRAYVGMSLFYGENPDMRSFHSAYHDEMVPFLAQAMAAYAEARL